MKPSDLKIAFFGTPQNAAIVLKRLISSQFKPSLVVTGSDMQRARGQVQQTPVKKIALENKIEVLEPKNLTGPNFKFKIVNLKFDLAILIAYGKLIPKEILTIPKYGFVNIHPSILPKYRGPSPIIEAILNGDTKTGVTIIKLNEELDHGPILAQKESVVDANDTRQTLSEKLAELGANLLLEILPDYMEDKLKPQEQNHSLATYTGKFTKKDGHIDLENPPDPKKLDRMIRAFYPWPGVWTEIESRVKSQESKSLRIKFLPSTTQLPNLSRRQADYPTIQPFLIQPEGKRPMTITEFLNGYPQVKGLIEKLTW